VNAADVLVDVYRTLPPSGGTVSVKATHLPTGQMWTAVGLSEARCKREALAGLRRLVDGPGSIDDPNAVL
jgi:hypothetical protein